MSFYYKKLPKSTKISYLFGMYFLWTECLLVIQKYFVKMSKIYIRDAVNKVAVVQLPLGHFQMRERI